MSDREIKVKDKRMFTAEGELREEYRDLREAAEGAASDAAAEDAATTSETAEPSAPRSETPPAGPPAAESPGTPPSEDRSARVEIPTSAGAHSPGFLDLISVLAEPVTLYLGDTKLPDGSSAENLEAARIHIDLLDVLRQKTVGNLSARESALLEDVLYQLRMRYVQKRG